MSSSSSLLCASVPLFPGSPALNPPAVPSPVSGWHHSSGAFPTNLSASLMLISGGPPLLRSFASKTSRKRRGQADPPPPTQCSPVKFPRPVVDMKEYGRISMVGSDVVAHVIRPEVLFAKNYVASVPWTFLPKTHEDSLPCAACPPLVRSSSWTTPSRHHSSPFAPSSSNKIARPATEPANVPPFTPLDDALGAALGAGRRGRHRHGARLPSSRQHHKIAQRRQSLAPPSAAEDAKTSDRLKYIKLL